MMHHEKYNRKSDWIFNKTFSWLNTCGTETMGAKVKWQSDESEPALGRIHSKFDRIDNSSFSGLLTRIEIGHICIGSGGNGFIKSCGSGSLPSHRK